MPQRIEDVLPEIKRARDAKSVDIVEEGKIKIRDSHTSPWEQAKANADRARRTLEGLGTNVYQVINDAAISPSEKKALQDILSSGGEDARDLRSLVACSAFNKMGGQGQAKALRLFIDHDRHIFTLMMVHSLSYQDVSGIVLEDICDHFTGENTLVRMQLSSLAETGIMQRHPLLQSSISAIAYDKEAKTILDVFDALSTTRGRNCLIDLCGYWYIALGKTSRNDFLVDHLYSIAINGIDPIFISDGISLENMLSSIMIECSDPGQVDQSARGTCTATSMQYVLCRQYPGEYVRIMNGLCSLQASVSLWNGDNLVRVNDSVPPDSTTRSPSERVFQSSLMLYALGSYSNIDPNDPGMNRDEEEKSLEALFGADFEVVSGDWKFWEDQGAKILKELSKRENLDKTFASLAWDNGGHFVFICELKGGRVYFRNPWGPTTDPVGTMYSNPTRRMENPHIGLESMTYSVFKDCARAIIWPKV